MKRLIALLVTAAMTLTLLLASALAAETGGPGYVLTGRVTEDGYELTVAVRGGKALTGQLALAYDPAQLRLRGGDRFSAITFSSGVQAVEDGVDEAELMDGASGYAGFAWYTASTGLNAAEAPVTIATLTFDLAAGVNPTDFDAGTFALRYVPESGFGAWESAAVLRMNEGGKAPVRYSYLPRQGREIALDFQYEGSDRPPADGHSAALVCRNALGERVAATVDICGGRYETDGTGRVALILADGQYAYRVTAPGYGTRYGALTVAGADVEEVLTFVNDETLVRQAVNGLELGFTGEDTAAAVTDTIRLVSETDTGVKVAWTSDRPSVVTREGLVYRPRHGEGDAEVTLTAALTHGDAAGEKIFKVTVLEQPAVPAPPAGDTEVGEEPYRPAAPDAEHPVLAFADLDDVPWAQEAILALASQGIVKGVSASAFSPLDKITRGDYTALLMRLMAPDAPAGEAFDDVPSGSYYAREITAARALGVADGIGGNRFEPKRTITRQEMMTLTARALEVTGYLPPSDARAELTAFADGAAVSSWAAEAVAGMAGRGFILGDAAGNLNPGGLTSRAEAAVFLYRIWTAAQT